MSGPTSSIGQVLDLLKNEFHDISISKIRFLESQGLIDPDRTKSGYRKFTEEDVNRLRWILEQQRDHFLPLKVIKERIDAENFGGRAQFTSSPKARGRAKTTSSPKARGRAQFTSSPKARGRAKTKKAQAAGVSLTVDELASTSGLLLSQISELEKFGLIEKVDDGLNLYYGPEAVIVANTVVGFLAHGVEPRHLRAYKAAVEREADLLEQRIMPLAMLRTQLAREQCQEMLAELVDLGSELRLSLLRMALANYTQSP